MRRSSEKSTALAKRVINMADRFDLFFRAHAIPAISQKKDWGDGHAREQEHALIFHCATTADEKQDLLFGAYICAQLKGGHFVAKEIGLFYRGGHPEELRVLKRFVKDSAFDVGTAEEFRRKVFLKDLKAGSLIVAYDAPFRDQPDCRHVEQIHEATAGFLVLFPPISRQENGQGAPQRLRTGAFD